MNVVTRPRVAAVALLGVVAIVASCTPSGPGSYDWKVEGTKLTINNVQDGGLYGNEDEAYLIQIAWRVNIDRPGSAHVWVVNAREHAKTGVGPGDERYLSGGSSATAVFYDVPVIGMQGLATPGNTMQVFGTYTWAVERDDVGVGNGADAIADILEQLLNMTLGGAGLPQDANAIFDFVFDNLGNVFNILLSNLQLLGLRDDILGGAVYAGIGAVGTLGQIVGEASAGVAFPSINLLGDNAVPPSIQGGGFFTPNGPRSFQQGFNGAGGSHTYEIYTGPRT